MQLSAVEAMATVTRPNHFIDIVGALYDTSVAAGTRALLQLTVRVFDKMLRRYRTHEVEMASVDECIDVCLKQFELRVHTMPSSKRHKVDPTTSSTTTVPPLFCCQSIRQLDALHHT